MMIDQTKMQVEWGVYHPFVYRMERDGVMHDVLVANSDLSLDMETTAGEKIHVPGPIGVGILGPSGDAEVYTRHAMMSDILRAFQHLVDWIGENLDR